MATFVRAGSLYFVIIFAGVLLGTLRELMLVPLAGRTLGVLIELAIILTISWIVCARLIQRLRIASDQNGRIVMGACAFVFLMIAEFSFAKLFLGWTPAEFFGGFYSLDGALGLIGQVIFGAVPLLQMRAPHRI